MEHRPAGAGGQAEGKAGIDGRATAGVLAGKNVPGACTGDEGAEEGPEKTEGEIKR